MLSATTIAQAVAERTGVSKQTARKVLKAFLHTVADALARGEKVRLVRFGVFKVVERPGRVYNVFGKGPVEVPPRRAVKFTPSETLKKKLR